MSGLTEFLKAVGPARLGIMAGITGGLIAFFSFLILRLAEPTYTPLYSNLDPDDAGRIVARLEALGVEHKLRGDGTTILVSDDKVLRTRMAMAEEGLPAGGSVGYEIFDNREALGTTSFVQNINHLRALEGELSRTIRALRNVDAARVHLVLPKREVFAREEKKPSASIVLRTRGSGVAAQQVKAIQHLVASAVEGLEPGSVSIIDQQGVLLASGEGESADGGMVASALEERGASFENRLRRQVEGILGSIVGPGKARVQVAAELHFNRITQSSESYDPESQVVRSTQITESSETNSESEAEETVSAGNELPDTDVDALGPTSASQSSTTEETINYEISRTTKTEIVEAGRIKRLSVAVLVDGIYSEQPDGTSTYTPRSEQELSQLSALVKSAIGFDEARGDQVEVINLQFAPLDVPAEVAAEEPLLGLYKSDYMRIAEMAILGILGVLVILLVFRPLINGLLDSSGVSVATISEDGAPAQLPGPDGAGAEQLALANAGDQPMEALPPPEGSVAQMIDIARVEGQVKASSVKKVGEIVQNHPEEAVAIVRSWMSQEA